MRCSGGWMTGSLGERAAGLERHEERGAARAVVWREHTAQARAFKAAYERMAEATQRAARNRDRGLDVDGLEL